MPSHKASAGSRQQVFVLVGGTGDLAMRMLWPSLAMLDQDGFLSESLRVISVARENISTDVMADRIAEAVKKRIGKDLEDATLPRFRQRITHVALDAARDDWGPKLKAELGDVANLDIVFFLSVSPSLFKPICEHIVTAGLNHAPNRVVIEKPIGRDLESSKVINDSVGHAFEESRIFRIDHYLGKETVQNLIALRFGNTVFEPLWNAQSIDHVQISISETVGTGERLGYYDEYGAIRDMLQNHLLQLLCLIAMEPPANLSSDALRDEKVKVLRSLKPMDDVLHKTARGQYGPGFADGERIKGYEAEKGSPSDTETYVAVKAEIANWRWSGTPFYLRTGKCLPSRTTEIVIQFKPVPHSIFGAETRPNRMVIRLQPDEDIKLTLMNKAPGLTAEGTHLQALDLSLSLTKAFDGVVSKNGGNKPSRRRIAYERLILDALNGNNAQFVRRDEVEAAWIYVDGIVERWKEAGMKPQIYQAGTVGPVSAYTLMDRDGRMWND